MHRCRARTKAAVDPLDGFRAGVCAGAAVFAFRRGPDFSLDVASITTSDIWGLEGLDFAPPSGNIFYVNKYVKKMAFMDHP